MDLDVKRLRSELGENEKQIEFTSFKSQERASSWWIPFAKPEMETGLKMKLRFYSLSGYKNIVTPLGMQLANVIRFLIPRIKRK